jgi:Cu/Ag efflux pump CusA
MKPDANYDSTLAAIRQVADDTPGIHGTVSTYESDAMGGVLTSPPKQVVTRIYGTDYPTLEKIANQVRGIMAGVSGVSNPQVQLPTQQPTIAVQVNLDEAAQYGVAAGDIRREAAVLIEGLTVGNFFVNQEIFDVTVQAQPNYRQSVQDVNNLMLDTVNGGHVRLGQVASVTVQNQPVDIKHENTFLYLDVMAGVSGRSPSAVASDISSRLTSLPLPTTFSTTVLSGSQLDALTQAGAAPGDTVVPGTSFLQFLAYVLAALLGIFLITQAAVGSWRLGLVAFGSGIGSLSGAMLVVYLAHWTGSLGAVAGLLGVYALAARQAISTISRIREGYQDFPRAVAGAAGHAVAVAVVTAAAVAPFAISGGTAGLELLWPAACVILGGLVTLTLFSLLVLPVACLWFGPGLLAPASESAEDEAVVPPQRQSGAGQPDIAKHPADQPVGARVSEVPSDPAALPAGQAVPGATVESV